MSFVALALILAAEPTTAVVLVRRTSVPAPEAVTLTERVAQSLALPGQLESAEVSRRLVALAMKDGTGCGGKASCHVELGRQLKVDWVVLVSVSQLGEDQSLALELLSVASEGVVENEAVLLPSRGEVPKSVLEGFAQRVKGRIRPSSDAPRTTSLTPNVTPAPIVMAPVAEPNRAPSLVLGGVGVAALAAGVALLINGVSLQDQARASTTGSDGVRRSELPASKAQSVLDAGTLQLGLAGASGVAAIALGAVAIAVW